MLIDEDNSALNGDDQTSGDTAGADQTGSDDTATDDASDDTAGADDTGGKKDDAGAGDQGTDDKTGDDSKGPVPYDRFQEQTRKLREQEDRAEQLQGQVDYLAEMIAKSKEGKPVTEKQQDKAQNALDELIESKQVTKEDAVRLQKIIDAMGYKRGDDKPDARVEQLERKIDSLTKVLGDKADREEKAAALKQYGDVITEDDLDAVMKEWGKSRDPDLKHAAQNWSYEKIIKLAFHDKIVASEVDKALKGKKSPAPKIDKKGGDKSPKKPNKDEFEWKSGDGETSTEALKRSILSDVAQDSE